MVLFWSYKVGGLNLPYLTQLIAITILVFGVECFVCSLPPSPLYPPFPSDGLGRKGPVFQGPYHRNIHTEEHHFLSVSGHLKSTRARNPVVDGLIGLHQRAEAFT